MTRPPEPPLSERRYTIMLVPERGRGPVRQVSVSLKALRSWVTLASLLAVLGLVVAASWPALGPERASRSRLVEENLALKGRLRAIEATLEEVDAELERLRLYDAQLQDLPEDALPDMGPLDVDELDALGWPSGGNPGRRLAPGELGDAMHALEGDDLGDDVIAWSELLEERARGVLGRVRLTEARLGVVAESAEYWRTRQAAMPTLNPCPDCDLSSGFGYRRSPFTRRWKFHSGLDLRADRGTPLMAAAPGTVLRAEWNEGYGRMIELDHGYGVTTRYAHNARVFVRAGDTVQRGDIIATIGMTGRTTGPHLHFEVRIDGTPVDPLEFLE